MEARASATRQDSNSGRIVFQEAAGIEPIAVHEDNLMDKLTQGGENSSSAASAEAASEEVRTSDWRNYDVTGFSLPDRGLIADWQARRFVTALTYLVFVAIVFLCFRFVPLLVILGPALAIVTVTGGREYLNRRTRDKLRSRILAEQRDGEFPVAVHFEIGSVEYGQDVGNLSFQEGWVYFEGRQEHILSWHQGFLVQLGRAVSQRRGQYQSRSQAIGLRHQRSHRVIVVRRLDASSRNRGLGRVHRTH